MINAYIITATVLWAAMGLGQGAWCVPGIPEEPPVCTEPLERVNGTAPEARVIEYEPEGADIEALARTMYGEARGCGETEQAAVAWCILNRLDSGAWGSTVLEVVSAPGQFAGYSPTHPVTEELYSLARDVLIRHWREQLGFTDTGRVLPEEYLYFTGDGVQNYFRVSYSSGDCWDWSLDSPYAG